MFGRSIVALLLSIALGQQALGGEWQRDGFATQRFLISGTGTRNNPLRKSLDPPFSGDELFVRLRLRYDAKSIDTPEDGDGEFLVLWMDQVEGTAGSTHANHVPNIGLHVQDDQNRFMVRFQSGNQHFGPVLEGDRDYLLVGRLWKSQPGESLAFDQLDLWVDPQDNDEFSPAASASSKQSIATVRWIGFSTGSKTEIDDIIEVWDIEIGDTWRGIMGLPPKSSLESSPSAPKPKTVSFSEHVYPILKTRCFDCHAGDDSESGVRLDILDETLNQISPGDAQASRLYQLVSDGKMPPEGERLSDNEQSLIANWIEEGLDWDESLLPTPIPQTEHWAFQPITRPAVPKVRNTDWLRTPVDAFIAAEHQRAGLVPNPPAAVPTLNRRMSLDLHGLPPEPNGDATLASVDELLADVAYGERWARHWLDVARWAESNGHQHNRNRPHAWRYRDWIVKAFNSGKTYDQFLREQIAGDEIRPFHEDHLIATGFLAAARYSGNELDKQTQRNDILVDVANTTASALLGLTLGCAQCHTHKFDPLSIRDYYRFQAFFASGQPANVALQQDERVAELVRGRWEIFDSVHARLVRVKRKQGHPEPIYVIPKSVVGGMNPNERKRFDEIEKQIAAIDQAWCYYAPSTASQTLTIAPHDMRWPLSRDPETLARIKTSILIRGDVKARGPTVQPGWPLVFGKDDSDSPRSRLALANWLTGRDHPLTARVWVNRLWQWHFGRGLVETSGDFGMQGTLPSHPELLNFLASELIEQDWDTRHIHRLILDSSTYRQSSRYSDTSAAIDPDNRLLWRWTPRRLEAESICDSVLAVSGQLDRQLGGPSVEHDSKRRSIYLHQKRDALPPQQVLFDSANGVFSCSRRRTSTNALQPLWLLNSDFMQRAAKRLAERAGDVRTAMTIAVNREPTDDEAERLAALANDFGIESACLAILNSSEFLYIP